MSVSLHNISTWYYMYLYDLSVRPVCKACLYGLFHSLVQGIPEVRIKKEHMFI